MAGRQFGLVAWRQLRHERGVAAATLWGWRRSAFLHEVLPGVYAVGHRAPSVEADLSAALLYAGPYAALSHETALWWFELTSRRPRKIHVSTPRKCLSLPGIVVHDRRRELPTTWHNQLRVTTAAQTLLDLATSATHNRLRKALAEADYRKLLRFDELRALLGRGRPGTVNLRAALEAHEPQFARTTNDFEAAFLVLCEEYGLPIPEFGFPLENFVLDALFVEQRVVVELDGADGHSTPAQMRRDRDLRLRQLGFIVLRYTWEQVTERKAAVAADVAAALRRRGGP